jgi:hypothetical protein
MLFILASSASATAAHRRAGNCQIIPTGGWQSVGTASTSRALDKQKHPLITNSGNLNCIGALLLGYYTPGGELLYAGRAGTGLPEAELERLWQRLQPLAIDKMPLSEPPSRGSRFGSPLVLSRVHWVRPEMVVVIPLPPTRGDSRLR